MVRAQHEDEPLPSVDRIKESVVSNSISPGLRHGLPEFLDVFPDVGMLSKLRIDLRGEFRLDAGLLPAEILLEVFLELDGFENAELNQRACPCAAWRLGGRRAASSSTADQR